MAARDIIKAQTRAALAFLAEGETWTLAVRTSAPGIEPPVFAGAVTIQARRADRQKSTEYDDTAQRYVERTTCFLTLFDDSTPRNGDQITGDGLTWAVMAVGATGQGLRRLTLRNDQPLLAEANRGGEP